MRHVLVGLLTSVSIIAAEPGLVRSEFIFERNPVPSCHATTIVEAKDGTLVAAWFAGEAEGKTDVSIWTAQLVDGKWSAPVKVAEGTQSDGKRYPCWNPVLFQPKEGPLQLYYKVGPNPVEWWGLLRLSDDNGKTWGEPRRLPDGILGPIKNKPVQLKDGTILSGGSAEGFKVGPSWQIHFERSRDNGVTWEKVAVEQPATGPASIQPSILFLKDGGLMSVGRTRNAKVFSTVSNDQGSTWSKVDLTDLPNPNSGTDAVTLKDGRHLLIYNHTAKGRSPLNLAISKDGVVWEAALVLEDEPKAEFSYPAIIQTADGLVHVTYTWKRKLAKHVVIDPAKIVARPMEGAAWPKASTSQTENADLGRTLTVGVIGHTGQGNYGHGEDAVWLKIPQTKIIAVADADPKGLATEVKKLGGVKAFADYKVMLAEANPDIVAICPRHIHEHRDMIVAAIEAGVKGIYIEKPFVRTLAEADEIVKLCADKGVRLAIAHRNRYHPVLDTVKQLIAVGEIGELKEVRVRGKQDQRGGGLDLWVLGGHGFNLATIFTGPATSCEATILVEGRPATKADLHPGDEGVGLIVGDEIHARYETKSGVPIFFDSKKGDSPKGAPFGARLIGTKGIISLQVDEEPLVILERDGKKTPITTAGIGQPEPIKDIKLVNGGHHGAVRDLLNAIAEKREPLCGPEAGRETIEMTTAVFASFSAGGKKISMPQADRQHPLR